MRPTFMWGLIWIQMFVKFIINELRYSPLAWKEYKCIYSQISISRSWWDFFLQVQITQSANSFALPVIWTCKSLQRQLIVGESNQNVFCIQINLRVSQNSRYPSSRYGDSTLESKLNTWCAGTNTILKQTDWIQASRRVTRRQA